MNLINYGNKKKILKLRLYVNSEGGFKMRSNFFWKWLTSCNMYVKSYQLRFNGGVLKQKDTVSTPTTQNMEFKCKRNVIKLRQMEPLCNERGKILMPTKTVYQFKHIFVFQTYNINAVSFQCRFFFSYGSITL
jgi:hypothetical protein